MKIDISKMLRRKPRVMSKRDKEKFDKLIENHEKEIKKRTNMTFEDWQQQIGNNIE